jgi:hypothetical protein
MHRHGRESCVCEGSETKSVQDSQDGVAFAVAPRLLLVAVDRAVGARDKNDGLIRLGGDIQPADAGRSVPQLKGERQELCSLTI